MLWVVQVAKYLAAELLGVFDETGGNSNIFIAHLPATPNECIGIFPTGGAKSDTRMNYDSPTIQIVVRGENDDPRGPMQKAQSIYDALHGFAGEPLISGGDHVVSCQGMQSAPIYIGQDENGRHQFSINFISDIRNDNSRRPE